MKKLTKYAYLLIIIILLILLMQQSCSKREAVFKERDRWKAAVDGLQSQILADGTEIARIKAISAKRRKAIQVLKATNDSISIKLADAIKASGSGTSSIVITDIITQYRDTGSIVIVEVAPECKNDTIIQWPVYSSAYHDKWLTYSMQSGKDTSFLNLIVYNQLSLEWKKRRFKQAEAVIKNSNPHTRTIEAKSWMNPFKPDGQIDYGFTAGIEQDFTQRIYEAGLYGEMKYRLLTADVSAGIKTDEIQILQPYVQARLKIAFRRHTY